MNVLFFRANLIIIVLEQLERGNFRHKTFTYFVNIFNNIFNVVEDIETNEGFLEEEATNHSIFRLMMFLEINALTTKSKYSCRHNY